MGKYLPVIKTAECGSLTRAAHALGYTQPSLGYIINNIEDELGVKLFYRDQRGATLTEAGNELLAIMRQIEGMEDRLRETARTSQAELFRVGILPSSGTQWIPAILEKFYESYPEVTVKLVHQSYYSDGEEGIRQHSLDCCFFTGKCPAGLESIPLYEDPYFLVVGEEFDLAGQEEISVWDVVGKHQFIPNNESIDKSSPIHHVFEEAKQSDLLEFQPQENLTVLALVERGLGVTLLPGMALMDLLPNRAVKVIPLKEKFIREVSLLCPNKAERSYLTSAFLRLTQQVVEEWKLAWKKQKADT